MSATFQSSGGTVYWTGTLTEVPRVNDKVKVTYNGVTNTHTVTQVLFNLDDGTVTVTVY